MTAGNISLTVPLAIISFFQHSWFMSGNYLYRTDTSPNILVTLFRIIAK